MSDDIREEFHRYTAGIIRNLDSSLLKINSVIDHVHLLCKIKPAIAVSDFVGKVKSNSSRWMKEWFELPNGFQWQSGYSRFSVSKSIAGEVAGYIESQQEHHKIISFADELKSFLNKHGIDYDPAHYLD